jgi:hypothetical protein
VHVVVVGLANKESIDRRFLFREIKNNFHRMEPENINPYLVDAGDTVVYGRSRPLQHVSEMLFGNMPNDGGQFLLSSDEKNALLNKDPNAKRFVKRLLGAYEFIQSKERWCLWLEDASEYDIASSPKIEQRVETVKSVRLASKRLATQKLASTPHLFGEIRQPKNGSYIMVPGVSSERRPYIPIGLFNADVISTNANLMIPNASLYEFGILTSEMHNDWMRTVAGRMKSDYRYSASLVYNTFPWPEVSDDQQQKIKIMSEEILLIREDYPDMSLSKLYNPKLMPEPLLMAHKTLDHAVEKLYRDKSFRDAPERLKHLFYRYEQLVSEDKVKAPTKKKSIRSK